MTAQLPPPGPRFRRSTCARGPLGRGAFAGGSFAGPFGRAGLRVAALGLVAALAACAPAGDPRPAPADAPQEAVVPRPSGAPESVRQAALRRERAEEARLAQERAAREPSPASATMRDYLAGTQDALIAKGRMKRDDGSSAGPITVAALTDDFVAIALRDEYERNGAALVRGVHDAPLRRWAAPVRMQVEFGPSVDAGSRVRHRADIAAFAARLSAVTGHPVSLTGSGGNFVVMILSEDDRAAVGPRLSQLVPGIPATDVQAVVDMRPQNFCTVFAYSAGSSPVYSRAVAVIRSELPHRMFQSCVHEELAQGMGLANDSPAARPSIFNDDEEYALLTRHDELLLRILYDPRLTPGMREAEARPIVQTIATELLGGNS